MLLASPSTDINHLVQHQVIDTSDRHNDLYMGEMILLLMSEFCDSARAEACTELASMRKIGCRAQN